MWWCHATPGDNTGAGDTRREGAANGAENIDNIHSEPELLSGVSLRIRLGCHMFARGAGAERGMSDAYQVLMADTQRGRPRAPPPVSVFVLRGQRLEDSAWPCSSNYVRPVLKIVDMSSFYARAYVNLVQAAPPTAPADTLVAQVWAKYGHFYKIHLSVVNCSQVNKQLYK